MASFPFAGVRNGLTLAPVVLPCGELRVVDGIGACLAGERVFDEQPDSLDSLAPGVKGGLLLAILELSWTSIFLIGNFPSPTMIVFGSFSSALRSRIKSIPSLVPRYREPPSALNDNVRIISRHDVCKLLGGTHPCSLFKSIKATSPLDTATAINVLLNGLLPIATTWPEEPRNLTVLDGPDGSVTS